MARRVAPYKTRRLTHYKYVYRGHICKRPWFGVKAVNVHFVCFRDRIRLLQLVMGCSIIFDKIFVTTSMKARRICVEKTKRMCTLFMKRLPKLFAPFSTNLCATESTAGPLSVMKVWPYSSQEIQEESLTYSYRSLGGGILIQFCMQCSLPIVLLNFIPTLC